MSDPVTLDMVIITDRLATRQSRPPDYQAENEVLHDLTRHMATGTAGLLQALVEEAVRLCHAGTAGISILEEANGERVFRWKNIAGGLRSSVGNATPFDIFSPLRHHARSGFRPAIRSPLPLLHLFPAVTGANCRGSGRPAASLQSASRRDPDHPPTTTSHRFDREDLRIMTRLASFATAVLKHIATFEENERSHREAKEAIAGGERSSPRSRTI